MRLQSEKYYVLKGELQEMNNFKYAFHNDIVDLGLPSGLLGERYCYIALSMLEEDPLLLQCMYKGIYNRIAERFGTNSACVERNLRTFVGKLWMADNHIYLNNMARCTLQKKPANRDFLDILFQYWKRQETGIK